MCEPRLQSSKEAPPSLWSSSLQIPVMRCQEDALCFARQESSPKTWPSLPPSPADVSAPTGLLANTPNSSPSISCLPWHSSSEWSSWKMTALQLPNSYLAFLYNKFPTCSNKRKQGWFSPPPSSGCAHPSAYSSSPQEVHHCLASSTPTLLTSQCPIPVLGFFSKGPALPSFSSIAQM